MPMQAKHAPVVVSVLLGVFLNSADVHAMSLDQMQALAGTALLDLRIDAVIQRCGLPSAIADSADTLQQRQAIRWNDVPMTLSSKKWEVIYSRQPDVAVHNIGWIHPGAGDVTCLTDLSELILDAKGDAGILAVKKRADNKGYRTTYHVPDSLYAAHQVIGFTGIWSEGVPIARIRERYGKPDEVVTSSGGIKHYRYWVVARKDAMPVSVHAVDFETRNAEKVCTKFIVRTSGIEFVQEKFDALLREWERDYVLD
jgi:hypothetical protein